MSDHICPPEHRHGDNSTCRAQHHCKCEECRRGAREYEFWRSAQKRRGRQLRVDPTGTLRRIRALQRIGWSQSAVARACDRSYPWVSNMARQRFITPATAERVRVVYDRLSMTPPPCRTREERSAVARTRRYAERAGWPPPLAWDDDTIDDPESVPDGIAV